MAFFDLERLRTTVTGYRSIDYVDTVGSTNEELLAHGRPGTVLLAGTQTAGRGRLGRSWTTTPGASIALSVLIDEPPAERLGLLPLAMGLAATDSIAGTQLKWPNDVVVGDKKLAGILAQAEFGDTPAHPRVVVGIGINATMDVDQLPVAHATSLTLAGLNDDPTETVEKLLAAFDRRQAQWKAGDEQLLVDYRHACTTIGQHVRLDAPGGDVTGRVEAVNDHGEIVIDGVAYSAGDVIHLRPQA